MHACTFNDNTDIAKCSEKERQRKDNQTHTTVFTVYNSFLILLLSEFYNSEIATLVIVGGAEMKYGKDRYNACM